MGSTVPCSTVGMNDPCSAKKRVAVEPVQFGDYRWNTTNSTSFCIRSSSFVLRAQILRRLTVLFTTVQCGTEHYSTVFAVGTRSHKSRVHVYLKQGESTCKTGRRTSSFGATSPMCRVISHVQNGCSILRSTDSGTRVGGVQR